MRRSNATACIHIYRHGKSAPHPQRIVLVHHPTSEPSVRPVWPTPSPRSPRPRHGDPTEFHLPDCPTRRDTEIVCVYCSWMNTRSQDLS